MAEQKQAGLGWLKWPIIIGVIFLVLILIAAVFFIFFFPSFLGSGESEGLLPPSIPEMVSRIVVVGLIGVVALVFLAAVAFVIYEMFFKKKELHIVQEHHKVLKESTMLNPVDTMRSLVLTGQGKIQHYTIGKIVGHTQVPIKIERAIGVDKMGNEDSNKSESSKAFEKRKKDLEENGRNVYDFFAFLQGRGVYGFPFFGLLEPVKIFACYPCERSPDLLGDVEIYDVGSWKISGVNIFVPANRSKEPMHTVKEFETQLLPIAYMGLLDYLGLIAQRGVEGDTALQKWLQTKASTVNIKESNV